MKKYTNFVNISDQPPNNILTFLTYMYVLFVVKSNEGHETFAE